MVDLSVETDIQGYDIDEDMVKIARENARLAGVDKLTISNAGAWRNSITRRNTVLLLRTRLMESVCRIRARCRSYTAPSVRDSGNWIPGSMYLITAYEQAGEGYRKKSG